MDELGWMGTVPYVVANSATTSTVTVPETCAFGAGAGAVCEITIPKPLESGESEVLTITGSVVPFYTVPAGAPRNSAMVLAPWSVLLAVLLALFNAF